MPAVAVVAASFVLSSPAVTGGGSMPARFTCDGADVSPPLRWTAPPAGTRTLSLRVVDLDTHPQFRHWTLGDLPAALRALPAATHAGRTSRNDFGGSGYGGPCPPAGQRHHYQFTLQALDVRGKPLAQARLLVTYRRR